MTHSNRASIRPVNGEVIGLNLAHFKRKIILGSIDRSGSMNELASSGEGAKADIVQQGLGALKLFATQGPTKGSDTQIGVQLFNHETTPITFDAASQWIPPLIVPGGYTHLGEAIQDALNSLETFLWDCNHRGWTVNRPVYFIYSDGKANGDATVLTDAVTRLSQLAGGLSPKVTLILAAADEASVAAMNSLGLPHQAELVRSIADWERLAKFISQSASAGRRTGGPSPL